MKFAHEAPNAYFNITQHHTDIDYFLVHMFEHNKQYWQNALNSVASGREVYLDNSVFELGAAFDYAKYAEWVNKLKPTWYILPDVLSNGRATIEAFSSFSAKYPDLPGKRIGVVQGSSWDDFLECYTYMATHADMVAISFSCGFYLDLAEAVGIQCSSKLHGLMHGRRIAISQLNKTEQLAKHKPHHLLGTTLPQEISGYAQYDWLYSIDTSNPVVHAIENVPYTSSGLETKSHTLLCDLMDIDYDESVATRIVDNIKTYREFFN